MALEIGSLLHNRYRVIEIIARGGMGAIYRAQDESLGVQVAIKENLFFSEESSRQFRREATLLAGLRHPNLPRVTDHFSFAGQGQYLVMDFIEGQDIRERLKSQKNLNEDEVLQIGVAVCDALDYLHNQTPPVIHRDIKPGNIKITPTGQVFLVDFGLAKVAAAGQATTTGAQALTPGYASPEQYGAGTTPLSDIYSLGATLYAALTGKIPEDSLARAMGSATLTPIRTYNPKISDRTCAVIDKSMSLSPADRFATARDFKAALTSVNPSLFARSAARPAQTGPVADSEATMARPPATPTIARPQSTPDMAPIPGTPIPPTVPPAASTPQSQPVRKPTGLWIGIAAVAVVAVIAAVFLLTQGTPPASPTLPAAIPTQAAATQTQEQPTLAATKPPENTLAPKKSPLPTKTKPSEPTQTQAPQPTPLGSSKLIAFASDRSGTYQIWVMLPDGSEPKQVTNLPDGACQPSWSPDGNKIVFTSPCRKLRDLYEGSSLFIIDREGTNLRTLSSLPGGDFEPAWSPAGDRIIFTSLRDGFPQLYFYNLDDDTVEHISNHTNYDRSAAWSKDGKTIAFSTTRLGEQQIWLMDADGTNQRDFTALDGKIDTLPSWSPDGKVLIFSQGFTSPYLIAKQTENRMTKEFKVSEEIHPVEHAQFSPDGMWIVYDTAKDGVYDICMMSRNGTNVHCLTENQGNNVSPVWRPQQ